MDVQRYAQRLVAGHEDQRLHPEAGRGVERIRRPAVADGRLSGPIAQRLYPGGPELPVGAALGDALDPHTVVGLTMPAHHTWTDLLAHAVRACLADGVQSPCRRPRDGEEDVAPVLVQLPVPWKVRLRGGGGGISFEEPDVRRPGAVVVGGHQVDADPVAVLVLGRADGQCGTGAVEAVALTQLLFHIRKELGA